MVELGLAPDEDQQSEEEFLEEETASQISTGVREIDEKMGGGIPKGSLTLIEGESSAGKSMMAHQIIWGSLRNELRAAIYTTENTYQSLITRMDSLNLDVLARIHRRRASG